MSKATVKAVSAGFMLISMCCTFAGQVQAQQDRSRGRPSGREAYESARARDRDRQNREWAMQQTDDANTTASERLKALAAQVREDFRRMQVVNNDMMRAASVNPSLDYKQIFDATGEINKCAKRLKTNLAVLDSDDSKKQKRSGTLEGAEMKQALFQLDDVIMGFVTSLAVVDSQKTPRSGRDLQQIIDLSDHIRGNAERMDKASQKP